MPSHPSYGDDETDAAQHLLNTLVREFEHTATIREGAAAMHRRDAAIADADAANAKAAAIFARSAQ